MRYGLGMDETRFLSSESAVYENEHWSGALSAAMTHADGRPYHTFRTATVLADGNHLRFRNCVFENTAGPAETAMQAIALYLDGDDIELDNCLIRGAQDTLFLAPLPEKELQKDGFLGPKQFEPRTDRVFVFHDCRIEGSIDFIFGGATAYFHNCEFFSNGRGYIFAPSTPAHVKTGFVADHCRFTADPSVPDGSCYIARPWRNYASVTLKHCELGRHIHPAGWHDWNKKEAHGTMRFTEMDSFGPGYVPEERPSFVRVI